MKKNKKFIFSIATVSLVASLVAMPIVAASCSTNAKTSNQANVANFLIKANGYTDAMVKLDVETATLAGGWGDTRSLLKGKDGRETLVVVGATQIVANDGIQAKGSLKRTDVEAVKKMFQDAVLDKENKNLYINVKDKKGVEKEKFVFSVYDHGNYSSIAEDAKISVDTKGTEVNAYQTALVDGGDYFEKTESGEFKRKSNTPKLKIRFIPSNDPAGVGQASKKLETYLNKKGFNVNITVATDYNAAALSLKNGSIDIAFLPAGSWAKEATGTNFILSAGRDVQVVDPYVSVNNTTTPAFENEKLLVNALNGYKTFNEKNKIKQIKDGKETTESRDLYVPKTSDLAATAADPEHGYTEELKSKVDALITEGKGNLPVVGYYRSYIMAKKDSPIAKKIEQALNEQGSNWKLNWDEVKDLIKYAYTSTTSSASYIFPEAWFKKHFIGFKTFQG
ncbi:PhnD/SsuA/transferrin family substrate-binding protein [Mycoplasma miroungirhinis]|uniref:PhnD/SsuA/transferrin family substrate-binding protein n=1 Tax=Mycoplasma miroungirhinis TaxID=754516 RepID=A0A6M4JCY6_9MOLU|nr:PhnD/SsuA/transferrin family substrate-binding protein [Mycoplasma miroungirhinis]QJR43937.1 PhnD/SsuA/transferrin family substrate-binding protein [Mycoplasma miroungirhinis]